MKKRKSPILLITILVICLGAVLAMNYTPGKPGEEEHPVASEGAQPGQPRTNTPSVADLAKKSKSAAVPPAQAMNPMTKAKQMGVPDSAVPASIENPTAIIQKPKPSDSSIAGQWYSDEARK
jgi:hypothetical protein